MVEFDRIQWLQSNNFFVSVLALYPFKIYICILEQKKVQNYCTFGFSEKKKYE